jgi:hypothetical protein
MTDPQMQTAPTTDPTTAGGPVLEDDQIPSITIDHLARCARVASKALPLSGTYDSGAGCGAGDPAPGDVTIQIAIIYLDNSQFVADAIVDDCASWHVNLANVPNTGGACTAILRVTLSIGGIPTAIDSVQFGLN